VRLFRTIPGLENVEFARLGGLHRNTYIEAPKLLDETLRLRADRRLRFAGQITGCEGYVESAGIGLLAGRFAAADIRGEAVELPPPSTALGALLAHITGGHLSAEDARSYQPMNVNFGLFPPIAEASRGADKGLSRKRALTARAKADLEAWLTHQSVEAAA
jgi:methylenetetrahydrofolate--tRNA-(uracil-5-)-methyltransferase